MATGKSTKKTETLNKQLVFVIEFKVNLSEYRASSLDEAMEMLNGEGYAKLVDVRVENG